MRKQENILKYIYIKEELQKKKTTTKAVQSAQGVYKGCQAKRIEKERRRTFPDVLQT